jgi:hypothetical protein
MIGTSLRGLLLDFYDANPRGGATLIAYLKAATAVARS